MRPGYILFDSVWHRPDFWLKIHENAHLAKIYLSFSFNIKPAGACQDHAVARERLSSLLGLHERSLEQAGEELYAKNSSWSDKQVAHPAALGSRKRKGAGFAAGTATPRQPKGDRKHVSISENH